MSYDAVLPLSPAAVRVRNSVTVVGNPDEPVLMFAHGFGCDQVVWSRVVPYFADAYRIVLFDHVGVGHSDPAAHDSGKYSSLDGYTNDLLESCDASDLEDVTLIAHSVGSMMAVTAAGLQPLRFKRLVLLAPSPCYMDEPSSGYISGFSAQDIDELLSSMDNNYFAWAAAIAPMVMGNPDRPQLGSELQDSFCQTSPGPARDFARVTFLSDSRDLLGGVTVPTVVLQCSDDAVAPLEVGDYISRCIPDCALASCGPPVPARTSAPPSTRHTRQTLLGTSLSRLLPVGDRILYATHVAAIAGQRLGRRGRHRNCRGRRQPAAGAPERQPHRGLGHRARPDPGHHLQRGRTGPL